MLVGVLRTFSGEGSGAPLGPPARMRGWLVLNLPHLSSARPSERAELTRAPFHHPRGRAAGVAFTFGAPRSGADVDAFFDIAHHFRGVQPQRAFRIETFGPRRRSQLEQHFAK